MTDFIMTPLSEGKLTREEKSVDLLFKLNNGPEGSTV